MKGKSRIQPKNDTISPGCFAVSCSSKEMTFVLVFEEMLVEVSRNCNFEITGQRLFRTRSSSCASQILFYIVIISDADADAGLCQIITSGFGRSSEMLTNTISSSSSFSHFSSNSGTFTTNK